MFKSFLIANIVGTLAVCFVFCSDHSATSESFPPLSVIQDIKSPAALSCQSSVVNDDGSFRFSSYDNGHNIEISGSLISREINGTKNLVLSGTYTWKHFSIKFQADEIGFLTYPNLPPAAIPSKVISTILG